MVYQLGEEVFEEEPFVHIVCKEFRSNICDFCFAEPVRKNTLKCCIRCKEVYYCGEDCQAKAFKMYHKTECPYFRCKKTMLYQRGKFHIHTYSSFKKVDVANSINELQKSSHKDP